MDRQQEVYSKERHEECSRGFRHRVKEPRKGAVLVEGQIRYLYLDELALHALLNFLADYLLLFASTRGAGAEPARWRLGLGAAVGTTYYVFYRLAAVGLLASSFPWRSWLLLPLIALLMLAVTLLPVSRRRYTHVLALFSMLSFFSAGLAMTVAYLLGEPGTPNWTGGSFTFLVAVPLTARAAWKAFAASMWTHFYRLRVTIRLGERQAELPGLLDTGNQLRDPFLDRPVLVAEAAALGRLFPTGVQPWMERLASGDVCAATSPLFSPWRHRFQVIPFSSLGQEGGLLWAFRPDEVILRVGERVHRSSSCLVAFTRGPLSAEESYRVLVPAALLPPPLPRAPAFRPRPADSSISSRAGGASGHASVRYA